MMLYSIQKMYESGDYLAICDAVRERFEVVLDHVNLKSKMDAMSKARNKCKWGGSNGGWSDSTWFMFLKNRIDELSRYPATPNTSGKCVKSETTAVMHVFFLYLEETPAMIQRLKNESKSKSVVARSKLTKHTAEFVEPVDSMATKVTR